MDDSEEKLLNSLKNNSMFVSMIDTHQSNDLSSICYEVLAEYRGLYQQKSMAVGRNKDNKQMKKDFDERKKHAKVQVNKLKHGLLTKDEVYEWLVNNK